MTKDEMWARYQSAHPGAVLADSWAFGGIAPDDPDQLAALVLAGKKRATASALPEYEAEGAPLPQPGQLNLILNGQGEAVCIIETTRVCCLPFNEVDAAHAAMEGEGDQTLPFWRRCHRQAFTHTLQALGQSFDESMPVVLEEFKRVYP